MLFREVWLSDMGVWTEDEAGIMQPHLWPLLLVAWKVALTISHHLESSLNGFL